MDINGVTAGSGQPASPNPLPQPAAPGAATNQPLPATPVQPMSAVQQPAPATAPPVDPALQAELAEAGKTIASIKEAYGKTIIGQHEMLDSIMVTLISRGHILVEGVPGLAKTTAVRAVATALGANFVRIQCTPDMLPSDILGNQIYNPQKHEFITQIGPINHQFVLVDEINRTGAKTQSALLEAMQERQITIGGETSDLPEGFMVLATQNPIEQEGTYLLPEAQLDRFLIKHVVTYPTLEEEMQIMRTHDTTGDVNFAKSPATVADIAKLQKLSKKIHVDDRILGYVASLVAATRNPAAYNLADIAPYIQTGASPRASLALIAAGRACALMNGHGYVTPDHIKPYMARILRHRISLTYEADSENITADQLIERLASGVMVP